MLHVLSGALWRVVIRRLVLRPPQPLTTLLTTPQTPAILVEFQPTVPVRWFLQWLFGHFLWLAVQTNLYQLWAPEWASANEDGPLYPDDYETLHVNFDQYPTREEGRMFPNSDVVVGGPDPPQPRPYPNPTSSPVGYNRTHPRPCDKKVDLYILQPERLNTSGQSNPLKGKLTNCHVTGCERPFSVQKIPCSNLILLVVDTLCPCGSKQLSITPQEVNYESVSPGGSMVQCRIKPQETMYRRRPPKCMNYHPEESEIGLCGGCSISLSSLHILALCLLVWTLSTVNCSSS
uniref:Uncharacterized protein n=1 Tax=Timema douglasi TaxID=61478 RepID=A0A7R8VME0_TIMDO|nr:unnamed protein product [Timema douglasi]